MKEKTKKILKGAGITLGAVALLTLGVAVGACSAKTGTKQQNAITTPVTKGLTQRPKKASSSDIIGSWQPIPLEVFEADSFFGADISCPFVYNNSQYTGFRILRVGGADDFKENYSRGFLSPKTAISIPISSSIPVIEVYNLFYVGNPIFKSTILV